MKIPAYAKINWFLQVMGRRPDGYHNLHMLMQRIQLHDTLYLTSAEQLSLQMSVKPSAETSFDIPCDENNIVLRSARLLQQECNCTLGAQIVLEKRIPSQAGLGGGSADAAATLQGLNQLWNLRLTPKQLALLGLRLGADVPYCLNSKPALVGGMGEDIQVVDIDEQYAMLLIQPEVGISTAALFSTLSGLKKRDQAIPAASVDATLRALQTRDYALLRTSSTNDLQAAAEAMVPQVSQIQRDLYAHGAAFAQMTGAGSVVFGVFITQADAERAAASLSEHYQSVILTNTLPDTKAVP